MLCRETCVLQNAHSCREEVPHDEGQLVVSYPKKFSLIDRALQLHFSTLEKTKIDHNPLLEQPGGDGFSSFPDLSSLATDFPGS